MEQNEETSRTSTAQTLNPRRPWRKVKGLTPMLVRLSKSHAKLLCPIAEDSGSTCTGRTHTFCDHAAPVKKRDGQSKRVRPSQRLSHLQLSILTAVLGVHRAVAGATPKTSSIFGNTAPETTGGPFDTLRARGLL